MSSHTHQRSFLYAVLLLLSLTKSSIALPTESRKWKTQSGHETTAIALKVTTGKVHLKKANGSVIKVDIELLVKKDQKILTDYFKIRPDGTNRKTADDTTPKKSGAKALTDLSQPQGTVVGPIEAGGSHYYLYLPKSLKIDRLAPLLFYTHSGGAKNPKLITGLTDSAETLGWIMAISIESSNKNSNSSVMCAKSIKHILETWPVDKGRIHYTGNSGGAARAFVNCSKTRAYGVMPNVGYIPHGVDIKTEVIYGLGGGNDYNRYLTAYAASKMKKNGFHRMSNKGHGQSPVNYYQDGMIWMHCKYMKQNKTKLRDEAQDFEAAIISYLNNIKSEEPQRAYSNACVVRDIYEISGKNAANLNAIITDLAKDKNNVLYHEALLDINDLSKKHLAPLGEGGGSKMKHFHSQSNKAAEKLKEKYIGVKSIIDILNAIMKKTV